MVFMVACIASFIPYVALFLWLRGLHGEDPAYRKLCGSALCHGALCLLPVILFSGTSYVIVRLTGVQRTNPLLYQALYCMIVLALMEELAKYLLFRRVLQKTVYPYSWMDTTVLMTIVGIGFGFVEAVIYAIGASVPVVLVRGICLPHAGYGAIVGWCYGKGAKYGKPAYKWAGFLISWLIHGVYDFSLSREFLALNDNLAFVAFLLALLDIVLVIGLIVFVNRAKKRAMYTEALNDGADASAGAEKAP